MGGEAAGFPSTHWSRILQARDDAASRPAVLEELIASYWKPLYRYARRRGLSSEDAKDAVQGFLCEFIARGVLERIDPQRGRLRALLRISLRNHINREHQHHNALKRGGGVRIQGIEGDVHLAGGDEDPDRVFDRLWARELFDRARERLQEEFASGRRQGPIELFLASFEGRQPEEVGSLSETAARHGLSATGLKSFLHRTRKRYRQLLVEEVAATLAEPDAAAVEAELEELIACLRR